jgi:cytidine deaminase
MQKLRFRASHLPAVQAGTKRITMRYSDAVEVGPALLVFEFDEEVTLPGRITSTVTKSVAEVTDQEAQEDGFPNAAAVLPGLRDYYPTLDPTDQLTLVRFEVTDPNHGA